MVDKIPHRKQKIEQHRPDLQSGVSAYSQFLLYVAHVALIETDHILFVIVFAVSTC